MIVIRAILCGFLLLSVSVAFANDLDKGLQAAENGDYAVALAKLQPLAVQGNAVAQVALGVMYVNGYGVAKDYAVASKWYRKSADQGNASAQYNLGLLYTLGQGVPQDYAEALQWLHKAADQGNADAKFSLGEMYASGDGVPQDYTEALKWYRKAVELGSMPAHNKLAQMYHEGIGVPQDDVKAYALWDISETIDNSDGNPAMDNRLMLTGSMTPSQIEAGQALSQKMGKVGVLKALDAQ